MNAADAELELLISRVRTLIDEDLRLEYLELILANEVYLVQLVWVCLDWLLRVRVDVGDGPEEPVQEVRQYSSEHLVVVEHLDALQHCFAD